MRYLSVEKLGTFILFSISTSQLPSRSTRVLPGSTYGSTLQNVKIISMCIACIPGHLHFHEIVERYICTCAHVRIHFQLMIILTCTDVPFYSFMEIQMPRNTYMYIYAYLVDMHTLFKHATTYFRVLGFVNCLDLSNYYNILFVYTYI